MKFISIYTQQLGDEALFNMDNIIFIDEPSRAVRFVGGEVYHTNEEGIYKLLVAAMEEQ